MGSVGGWGGAGMKFIGASSTSSIFGKIELLPVDDKRAGRVGWKRGRWWDFHVSVSFCGETLCIGNRFVQRDIRALIVG